MELRNLIFYYSKPLIPRLIQIGIRRAIAVRRRKSSGNIWPIDKRAGRAPVGWKGWPEGKRFAFLLMHDVDTCEGQRKAPALLELDKQHGFRSSFNFVPERYPIAREIQDVIRGCGYEVGVHGLRHDGKLFLSRSIFQKQAKRINAYLKEWGSLGFASPSTLRNLDYTAELDILYDISTFDTDPFEPQPYAVRTVFPFIVYKNPAHITASSPPGSRASQLSGRVVSKPGRCFVEMPYTLPQDHCLFVIMREKDCKIWKEKLDWIAERGGMALLITHPDYMNFGDQEHGREHYPAELYVDFLKYVNDRYRDQYWNVLPSELAQFWLREMDHHKTGPDLEGLRFQGEEYCPAAGGSPPGGRVPAP